MGLLLTQDEAINILRRNGVSISPDFFKRGVDQGVFPFGKIIHGENQDKPIIPAKKMAEWLKEIGGDINANSNELIWSEQE